MVSVVLGGLVTNITPDQPLYPLLQVMSYFLDWRSGGKDSRRRDQVSAELWENY